MSVTATITLPNKFDYAYHGEFQRQCAAFIEDAGIKELVFDFSRVEYLDSAALGMMMMWQRRAASAKKKAFIKGAKGTAVQILEMANMQRIFQFI